MMTGCENISNILLEYIKYNMKDIQSDIHHINNILKEKQIKHLLIVSMKLLEAAITSIHFNCRTKKDKVTCSIETSKIMSCLQFFITSSVSYILSITENSLPDEPVEQDIIHKIIKNIFELGMVSDGR